MVDCAEFLDGYSEYRDGVVEPGREAAFDAHLRSCASCARYDRVVGGGVQLFRDLPELAPSSDFQARLQHRIFHLEDEIANRRRASGASLALTVALCAALGVSAWLPTVRSEVGMVRLPPVIAHAPYHDPQPVPLLYQTGPLLVHQEFATSRVGGGGMPGMEQSSLLTPVVARPVGSFYYPR